MPGVRSAACFTHRLLLMAGVVLLSIQPATAQQESASGPPESVVLVLKLVSATHVRPTTGVVISDDGLVLIPAEFIAAGDEIVILDGGTDIVRNGRPSRPVKRSLDDGLAVLSVAGLTRSAIILSDSPLSPEQVYHLAAFPPAEKMAEGAEPLWLAVRLTPHAAGNGYSVSAETPLPNITGPIVDQCGYLVGINLATGAQSLSGDDIPVSVIGDDLDRAFDSMQISLQRGACRQASQPTAQAVKEETQERGELDVDGDSAESVPETVVNPGADELPADSSTGSITIDPVTYSKTKAKPDSFVSLMPIWLWAIMAVLLLALLAKAVFYLRVGNNNPPPSGQEPAAQHHPVASDEPATAPLDSGPGVAQLASQAEPADADVVPDVNALPDGFNGVVVIEGLLGNESRFKRHCIVNTQHIDVVIGRGDADISIDAAAISRHHVRIKNIGEAITISDLDSSNGTFIRGIPCLPGEIMYIDANDEILLGDVRFKISVLSQENAPS